MWGITCSTWALSNQCGGSLVPPGHFPINVGDHLFHLGTFQSMWGITCSTWALSNQCGGSLVPPGHFPINVVVILLYMYGDAIPVITSPYSLSVLSESGLQVPLGLAYVHLITAIAGDLVHYRSLLLVWYLLLHVDQKLPHGVGWLEDIALIPRGPQTFSIFLLSWRMYIRQSIICSSVVDFWGSSSEGG